MLYKLKYINNLGDEVNFGGETIKFRDTVEIPLSKEKNPFSLIKFEGFGEVEASLQMQKFPYQDGSTHVDTRLEEKHPYIEFIIMADDFMQLSYYRRYISKVFNPKIQGRIELIYGDKTYVIDAIPEQVPSFPDEGTDANGRTQTVSVNLVSPDPYWRYPQKISRALKAYEGRFTLPFTLPFELGVSGDSTTLTNEGNVDCPITIDVQGPVTRPQIRNLTTGKFMLLNRTLSSNEVLHINTSDHNKRAEIYRDGLVFEKAWGYIDDGSEFFKLITGDNELEYLADSGVADAIVSIGWQSRYVGI
ncbi:hypothetical protein Pryu01_02776 [Paraliobacillus ryukyuensis]|uniref:Tail protein n=1 Tax=Paraliobacillus ryukyuensis TaxID=200904 RepID=A0A366DVE4_9BACI|nr:phage tail domain-containing protein [Paraliobacillus ryukyuensis]RBO93214.1 tail protein [Paraliobacillus ryukyuensis]